MIPHIEEKNDELRRDLFVYIENHTEPKLDAIKEGLDAVLDHDYVKHEELEPIKEKIIVLEDVVKNHSAEIAELKRARKKRIYLPRATVDSTVALSLCLMSSSSTNRNLTISVTLVYRRKLTTQSVAKRPQEERRGED